MDIKLKAQWVIGSKDSIIASSEKKDCVVYAIASSFDLDYDTAHEKVRMIFDRKDKKGTRTSNIVSKMKDMADTRESINGKFVREVIDQPTKTYHVYGKDFKRKNRVSTFIKEHSQGTYLILTSGHALTIKDGTMIDNITKGSGSKLITKAFKVEPVITFQP
jgi:hypothetical protein